ncbi:bifunctional folylpolyglutamate synthase/dihydrofolate synthase [Jonesia quinghaiensis]|uniref:bifunctional folylpolyglutamate synthase/dihydrofolate synthase n=1 Tax=Jonesia quinghaiensis TaxID=262806 RepID=UPI0003F9BCC1|nr:folylpolyglutamate synthase/dihydrofolate synthase family protein [Jonesia quinghaiensis]
MQRKPLPTEPTDQELAELREIYGQIMTRNPEHDFEPTLDRVRHVLDLLGNPQNAYRTIHITGTNGKTSTARMVEALIDEHGLRTGRFTSPHLTSVTERITIDSEPISPRAFVEVYHDVAPYIEMADASSQSAGGPRLSFFEVLTVMAYAAFADAPVDVAVIEVGLGGTWDATNVIDPEVSIITPISLDHTQWLGDTLHDIATEKAGIIKPHRRVVVAQQEESVHQVIVEAAQAVSAHLIGEPADMDVTGRAPAVGGQMLTLTTPAATYTDIFLPLFGRHQAHNALLALVAAEGVMASGAALRGEIVEAAFGKVTSPGRLELVRSSPAFLVDAAHNPGGIDALIEALDESFQFHRLIGVVGIFQDKDAETILSLLEPVLAEIVITQSDSDRSRDTQELAELAEEIFGEERVHQAPALDEALDIAATQAELYDDIGTGTGTGVIVTGSVILAAQARTLLGKR